MRLRSLLLLLLLCLACLAPAARAQEPSLLVFASVRGDGELARGESVQVVLAVYSTSVETSTLTLDAPAPAELQLLRQRWNQASWVRESRPALIVLDYQVKDDAHAGMAELRYVVKDAAGHTVSTSAWVRVGRPVAPRLWLPVVEK